MKSFITAIILFFVTVSCVMLNSFYVNHSLAKISDISLQISSADDQEPELNELTEYWCRARSLLGFSIKETKLERMTELIEALKFAIQSSNRAESRHFCALIQELCEETRNYEKISLQSIF